MSFPDIIIDNAYYENLEHSSVIVNDVPTFRVDDIPYGDIKDSGLGREGLKYAILDMVEPKILVTDKRKRMNGTPSHLRLNRRCLLL